MQLHHTDIISAPLATVYGLVRDELPKIVQYLPNVKKVERLSYESNPDGKIRIVNHWFANAEVPGMVKKFISDDFFAWKDKAIWNDSEHRVDYELESFFANDLFEAHGTNLFSAHNDQSTKLELTCKVTIHPEKIPGIPRLLAKGVQPALEKLIEKMLEPNLTSLGQGLKSYFKNQLPS